MESYSGEIVDNIKHEPERHFVFIMPDDPEIEVTDLTIVMKKFDKKWKNPPEIYKTYFVCGKCGHATRESRDFKRHLKICELLEKCKDCGLVSKSKTVKECCFCDLKFDCNNCKLNHTPVHGKGSNWHCSKCDHKTSCSKSLWSHYKTHSRKFSCETCQQTFALKPQLKNHQQQHQHGVFANKPKVKFDCKICERSFANIKGIKNHEKEVHSKLELDCDICGKVFKAKINLQHHMQTHLRVPCTICQKKITKYYLKDHLDTHSSKEKFECDICGKEYLSKKKFYCHMITKHKTNRMQCDLCCKFFKNKPALREHIGSHIMVSCSICKRSINKNSLRHHLKQFHSSGQKFLACTVPKCPRKFENLEELKAHKKIHIGRKNYKCPNCIYRTTTMGSLKKHVKSMHSN